jgi:hypothetical protein
VSERLFTHARSAAKPLLASTSPRKTIQTMR